MPFTWGLHKAFLKIASNFNRGSRQMQFFFCGKFFFSNSLNFWRVHIGETGWSYFAKCLSNLILSIQKLKKFSVEKQKNLYKWSRRTISCKIFQHFFLLFKNVAKYFYIKKLYNSRVLPSQLFILQFQAFSFMLSVSNELNQRKRVNINYISNEYFWDGGVIKSVNTAIWVIE